MSSMSEPKPFASLSSGLLARKGTARPAMRRAGVLGPSASANGHDDLGWNDMGYDLHGGGDEPTPVARDDRLGPDYRGPLAGAVMPQSSEAAPLSGPENDSGGVGDHEAVPEVVRQREALNDRLADMEMPAEAPMAGKSDELSTQGESEPLPAATDEPQSAVLSVKPARQNRSEPTEQALVVKPEIVRKAKAEIKAVIPAKRAAKGKRAAFTLRLDPERHLRLRLACAVSGRSAQQVVTQAIDDLLTTIPEIEDLVARVPNRAGK